MYQYQVISNYVNSESGHTKCVRKIFFHKLLEKSIVHKKTVIVLMERPHMGLGEVLLLNPPMTPSNFLFWYPWEMILSFRCLSSLGKKKKSFGGSSGNKGWKKTSLTMLFLGISCATLSEWKKGFLRKGIYYLYFCNNRFMGVGTSLADTSKTA